MDQRVFEAKHLNHDVEFPPPSDVGTEMASLSKPQQPPRTHGYIKSERAHRWSVQKPLGTGQDPPILVRQPPVPATPNKSIARPPSIITDDDKGRTLPLFILSPSVRDELLNPKKQCVTTAVVSLGGDDEGATPSNTSLNYFTAQSMTSTVLDDSDWSENTDAITNKLESVYHQMVKNEIKAYETRGYFEEYTSFDDSYDNNSLCDTNSQFDWENYSTNASSTSLYSNEWGEEESEIDETELYENVRIAAANLRAVISDEKEQHQRQPSPTINPDEVFYDCITWCSNRICPIATETINFWKRKQKHKNHSGQGRHKITDKDQNYAPLQCISIALQKVTLLRRCFFPRRDVIRWTTQKNGAIVTRRLTSFGERLSGNFQKSCIVALLAFHRKNSTRFNDNGIHQQRRNPVGLI
jgi:hypothetical protein